MIRVSRFLSTIAFTILFVCSVFGQDEKLTQINLDGDTIELSAIALTQITSSLETDYSVLSELVKVSEEENTIDKFDSIYNDKYIFLKEQKAEFEEKKETYSPREVSNALNVWKTYNKMASDWIDMVNNKTASIEQSIYTVRTLKKVWELTEQMVLKSEAPQSVIQNVKDMQGEISKTEDLVISFQNGLLQKQTDLSNMIFMIKEVISSLTDISEQQKSEYFTFESPIWAGNDSTIVKKSFGEYLQKSLSEDQRSITIFFQSNKNIIYLHILIFIFTWLAFFFLKKQSVLVDENENEADLQNAKYAISRHAIPALVISLFISIWLYPEISSAIRDLIQLIYIVIAIIFLPSYIDKRLKNILYVILVLFFIDQFQYIFPSQLLIYRILLLLKAFIAGWILYETLKKKGIAASGLTIYKTGFIVFVLRLFYLFLVVSIIGNIIGLVYPAAILCETVVNSLLNLVIIVLVIITLNRSAIILLRTKLIRKSNFINNNWRLVEKRITSAIYIVAAFLWVKGILRSLNIYEGIEEWFAAIFQITWKVGNTVIELGGILLFFTVIILTILIYRIIKTLLSEELYPRVKLPRGVPGAISMIVGYVIVAYGIFLALVSAGVNLSQFGLIAGALGVGIGFGLQNIVGNFIAGLVLAFERPIQVGDTIEAGTVMGDVTAIGVRACTIRTFDGSEVMVPNGNLIANDVINWTLSDRKKRYDIFVSVAYGNNPHDVIAVLRKAAEANPNVLKVPAPWLLFDGFGSSSLDFRVRIWTGMDVGLTTKSEVAMEIYDALGEAGIEIPFPQQDLHIKSMDPSVEQVIDPGNSKMNKK